MTSRVDFTSQSYFRDPAAPLERLRSRGPVVEVNFPIVGRVWTTTTQAMADRVLKDTDTFTIRKEDGEVAGLRWWMPGIVKTFATNMLSMDEPDHKRLRDIVDEAFRRRAVLEMERTSRRPQSNSPMNCLPKVALPIWSSAMRANCRCW